MIARTNKRAELNTFNPHSINFAVLSILLTPDKSIFKTLDRSSTTILENIGFFAPILRNGSKFF
jgi:hypothetical protein